MNKYYYNLTNGTGVLLQEINGKYKLGFLSKEEIVQADYTYPVSNDIIDKIKDDDFDNYFNYSTIRKATGYIDKNVLSINVIGKSLVGKVKGTEIYDTRISFTANSISTSCSCPVNISCKHAYALIKTYSNQIKRLNNKYNISFLDGKSEDVLEFNKLIDKYKKNRNNNKKIEIAKEMGLILERASENDVVEIFKKLHLAYSATNTLIFLKRYIITNDKLFTKIHDLDSRLNINSFYSYILSDYHQIRSNMYSAYENSTRLAPIAYEYAYYKNLSNAIYEKAMLIHMINEYDIESTRRYFYDDYEIGYGIPSDIPEYIIKDLNYTEGIIESLFENDISDYVSNSDDKELAITILKKSNFDKRLLDELIIYIDPKEISEKYLSKEVLLSVLDRYDMNTKRKIIEENFDEFVKIDYKKLLEVLWTGEVGLVNSNIIKLTLNNPVLKDAITIVNREEPISTIAYKYLDFKVSYMTVRNSHDGPTFSIDFDVYIGKRIYTRFKLDENLCDKRIYNDYTTYYYQKELEEEKELTEYYYSVKENEEELQNKISEFKDAKIKYEASKLDNLIKKFSEKDKPLLRSDNKAHLSFIFHMKDDEISLELKIGIEKEYIIKDIVTFLRNVVSNEFVSFGKSLSLVLNINNFDEASKNALELLLTTEAIKRYYGTRSLEITNALAEKLFFALKGKEVNINGISFNIILDEIKFNSYIDNDFKIKIDNNYLFKGLNYIFIYDDKKNINYINSKENNEFIKFMYKNKDMNLKYNIDTFKENVYYKYQNYISLSDNILEDFKIAKLDINAYFDYDATKKIITLEYKIFKNDIEVNIDSLDKNENERFNYFLSYIDLLGFDNNILAQPDDIYNFFMMDFDELKRYCNVYLSETLKAKTVVKMTMPQFRITYENSMLEAIFDESSFDDEELYQIINSIKKKKKYVILKDNRIVDLNNDEANKFYEMVNDFNLDKKSLTSKNEIPVYQALKSVAYKNNIKIDDYLKKMIDELTNFKNADFKLPELNAELRRYQKEGFNFLKILAKYNLGGILADDMGLGKTLEVITLFADDEANMPSLVVCPKSLIFNWLSEFEKFSNGIDVVCVIGTQLERKLIINDIKDDLKKIYVISYDSLRNDINLLEKKKFNYIILDEAQYIKNVEASKSKSVKLLNGAHKFALTGTPIENNILDLWSIFDFLMPNYFEEISEFKSHYNSSPEFTDEVALKVAPFILRRTKMEVLKDLPPKYERIISCEMTKEQRKIYDAVKLEAKQVMEMAENSFQVLPFLTRLRQICVDPSTYIENYEGSSGKMNELYEIINDNIANNRRMLIFSSFVKALDIVKEHLHKEKIRYFMLTGETSLNDRKKFVDEFNKSNDVKIFLISLKAGGTGLNLTGAEVVIHIDPWWNIAAMDQATDRAHRIGQTKTVEVIKLVSDASIEQRVIQLQNQKKDLIDKLISKNDESITNFKFEDLKFILE